MGRSWNGSQLELVTPKLLICIGEIKKEKKKAALIAHKTLCIWGFRYLATNYGGLS